MSDTHRNCATCRSLRTNDCRRPDVCVSGNYKDYAPAAGHKKCRNCGAVLRTIRTDPHETVVIIQAICPDCGVQVDVQHSWSHEYKT